MLAAEYPDIRARLLEFRRAQTETVLAATLPDNAA
jgi:hypothetical protein